MTEEEIRTNRLVLEELGLFQENESEYSEDYLEMPYNRNKTGIIVNQIAKKIANDAFNSKQGSKSNFHFSEHTGGAWNNIKDFINRPGVREVALIGSVLLLKIGLFYASKFAIKEGLEEILEL